ncbi:hypothetical protein NXV73_06260 [Bacteroides salyersiae]|nr:hypothetical protein [Bacteroides salyersiae]
MQDKNMNDYKGINVYLNASNVGKGDNAFSFIQGNRFIIFIPTNEAVMADMTTGPKRFPRNRLYGSKKYVCDQPFY